MKVSEEHKWGAKRTLIAGSIFITMCLVFLSLAVATGEALFILGCTALLIFTVAISVVDYYQYKNDQREMEAEEKKENSERQKQLSSSN